VNRPPPPLLGFNNNVRHNGRVFHIQTEDSGIKYCRVVTHLFADGGQILRTSRTEYSQHKDEPDLAEQIRRLMKEQHRSMFAALRAGEFDEVIHSTFEGHLKLEPTDAQMDRQFQLRSQEFPALSLPAPGDPAGSASQTPASRLVKRPSNRPKRTSSLPPAKIATRREGKRDSTRIPANNHNVDVVPPVSSPSLRLSRLQLDPSDNTRHESTRSLFGDAAPSEQSLGDVILNYVEDASDKGSGQG
jgi:hypothetical protein